MFVGWFAVGRPRLSVRARRLWQARIAASASFLIITTAAIGVMPVAAATRDAASPDPGPAAASSQNSVPLATAAPPAPITSELSGGGPVPNGGVGVRVTPQPVQRPPIATDVAAMRTEYSNVTANPDGTYTSVVSSGRVNFKATDGSWQPIDVSLVADSSDGYDLRTNANDRTVRVNDVSGADQMATLQAGTFRSASGSSEPGPARSRRTGTRSTSRPIPGLAHSPWFPPPRASSSRRARRQRPIRIRSGSSSTPAA